MTGIRNRHFLFLDLAILPALTLAAFALRFETFDWRALAAAGLFPYLAFAMPVKIGAFTLFGLYRRLWRHATIVEYERLISACIAAGFVCFVIGAVALPASGLLDARVPLSVLAIDALFTIAAVAATRVFVRIAARLGRAKCTEPMVPTLIIGAGEAGQLAAREMRRQPGIGFDPAGFLDDDPLKQRLFVGQLPVLGRIADLPRIAKARGIRRVIIAMPSVPGSIIRRIVELANHAGVETRTLPGLFEILSGRVAVTSMRDVQIEDLLRRSPIDTNLDAVRAMTAGRTIMVTGAGGSIGSELCRQLAQNDPGTLVLLGHGENSIFEIHQELLTNFPHLRLRPVIADIRDRKRIDEIVRQYRPYAIFHAAAHKHVPLMEANSIEALSNNVLGTHHMVASAVEHGVAHFVMISTDKAVRPTSVMGASKRVAEQIVQFAAARTERHFVAVRFGNVLGSRGSVIPTFLHQIRAGGPVLVTHPEMRRYFITIPEAVQLVLQAFTLGRRGEVFCLDMGEPVRIVDLARDLIQLSGLNADADIEIRFTGIRPGEKLFEEMFLSAEQVHPTEHPKVLRARHAGLPSDVGARIDALLFASRNGASELEIRSLLANLVPDFSTGVIATPPMPAHLIADLPDDDLATVHALAATNGNGNGKSKSNGKNGAHPEPPQITAL